MLLNTNECVIKCKSPFQMTKIKSCSQEKKNRQFCLALLSHSIIFNTRHHLKIPYVDLILNLIQTEVLNVIFCPMPV